MSFLDGYLTRDQLASELGRLTGSKKVCRHTIKRWEDRPNGLPFAKIGNKKLYRKAAVLDWLQSQERRPNPRRRRSTDQGAASVG